MYGVFDVTDYSCDNILLSKYEAPYSKFGSKAWLEALNAYTSTVKNPPTYMIVFDRDTFKARVYKNSVRDVKDMAYRQIEKYKKKREEGIFK